MKKLPDFTGQTFGRWKVLSYAGRSELNKTIWNCVCLCGNSAQVLHSNLQSGHSRSCGCAGNEILLAMSRTHGKHNTRIYRIWNAMKTRCSNSKRHNYKYYGGRGILVCAEWLKFEPFEKWATENGYASDLTLDRENVNQGYSPDNCRWVTQEVQARNQRNSTWIEFNGERKHLNDWADIYNTPRERLRKRLIRMSFFDAVSLKSHERVLKTK